MGRGLLTILALVLPLLVLLTVPGLAGPRPAAPTATRARDLNVEAEPPPPDPLRGVSLAEMQLEDGAYRQRLDDGRAVTFTVDPDLQRHTDRLFARYKVPAAAAVVLNSRTGRVLALSQQRLVESAAERADVAFDPSPPAASLFKIITAAALLQETDVRPETRTCYSGGGSRLVAGNLEDRPSDKACASLAMALGRSVNAIFAKLSDRLLEPRDLLRYAEGFGFNRRLSFDVPLPISPAEIPADRLERARTAAGFWHTHISPLHAAMIAQAVAQGGAMLRPYIVDRITAADGTVLHEAKPQFIGRVVEQDTARELIDAMSTTVKRGTGRRGFHDERGRPFVPGVTIAGKTGTLTGSKPYRAYSWFVGLAPADRPEVAIAVLVVNEPKWRIKSTDAAARILARYFEKKTD